MITTRLFRLRDRLMAGLERFRRWLHADKQQHWVRPLGSAAYIALAAILLVSLLCLAGWCFFNPKIADGCDDPTHELPNYAMLIVGLAGMLAGRIVGYLRYDEHWAHDHFLGNQHAPGRAWIRRSDTRHTWELAGIVLITLFALVSTGALVFEGVGVAHATRPPAPALEPITFYMRCAVVDESTGRFGDGLTFVVLFAAGVLVGQWLWAWHLPRQRKP